MEDWTRQTVNRTGQRRSEYWISGTLALALVIALGSASLARTIPDRLSIISPAARAALTAPPTSNPVSGQISQSGGLSLDALVFFREPLNHGPLSSISRMPKNMSSRRRLVLNKLQSFHSSREEQTLNTIKSLPGVEIVRRHWVTRSVLLRAPVETLANIAELDGVSRVVENVRLEYVAPVSNKPAPASLSAGVSSALQTLSVPQLWAQGITGKGRIVASFDTGVEGTHPALASNYHGANASAQSSFFAPNSTDTLPFDNVGHGSHTMGIMVGNTPTDSFGVAPGAEWINAAVIDQGNSLNGTLSDILAAFEWALDPDGNPNTTSDMPDVILNSWGLPVGLLGPCDNTFWDAIDNVEQAGIVTIFAAGNEGPTPFTIRSPANRIASPLNSFAIGAIDQNTMLVADFSSRGPSTCDSVTIKPEVVAPGVDIYSADKGGGYRLRSGTSMAAPFIAGMVALMRQYNPDATVAQIKQAIIGSAVDLGPAGNDNSYGHGFPDAVRALALIPPPSMPQVSVTSIAVDGDGVASPGEMANLTIYLQTPIGSYDTLRGTLRSTDEGRVSVVVDTALLTFSPATGAGISLSSFVVHVADSLIHGATQTLTLDYYNSFGGVGSVSFELTIGVPPLGEMYTHTTSALQFTVSDFAQFGLGAGSSYQAGGVGLRFGGGMNLLYESGIVVGRNTLQLASSVRDSNAVSFYSDFASTQPLTISLGSEGASVSESEYTDRFGLIPLPVMIKQRTETFTTLADAGYAIIEFSLLNPTLEPMTDLRFGYFNDFDLGTDPSGDNLNYDPGLNMLYQYRNGVAVGIVALSQSSGALSGRNTATNTATKVGFTQTQLYSMLTTDSLALDNSGSDDYFMQVNFGPFNLAPQDSAQVALALVVGADLNELADNAVKARNRFLRPTGIDDDENGLSTLPEKFELAQNYPNPFNPSTTIEFAAPRVENAQVAVYNVLGQQVTEIFDGQTEVGVNRVTWDGTDSNGSSVASGVYFYRLKTATGVFTRKMTFLK